MLRLIRRWGELRSLIDRDRDSAAKHLKSCAVRRINIPLDPLLDHLIPAILHSIILFCPQPQDYHLKAHILSAFGLGIYPLLLLIWTQSRLQSFESALSAGLVQNSCYAPPYRQPRPWLSLALRISHSSLLYQYKWHPLSMACYTSLTRTKPCANPHIFKSFSLP